MIPGFDLGVRGMATGETKEIKVAAADAYGEIDDSRVQEVPVERLPDGCKVGDRLSTGSGGQAVVTKLEGDTATLDLNHPLAGQSLTFTVTLVTCAPEPELEVETVTPGNGVHYPAVSAAYCCPCTYRRRASYYYVVPPNSGMWCPSSASSHAHGRSEFILSCGL